MQLWGRRAKSSGDWERDLLVFPVIRETRDCSLALLTCDCGEPGERDLAEQGDLERGERDRGDCEWERDWEREWDDDLGESGAEPRKPLWLPEISPCGGPEKKECQVEN